ncbi:LuxR C-terminal-related transcriptional regulator [uncultured Vagococcus sp.]|uniref:helix-turn-helix transcriptional regulator n=1 Tax=uncultured Vagococcus sp. TaxID=189676 RepID=UPI0028D3D847|nr:LuxR C-terminal-related transcriptional regulator [uncultured Vagococcus sp.]
MTILLSTKLRKPHVSPNYLERPRLRRVLDGMAQVKLTILEANPGSGKSMLLASYFEEKERLIWLNLTADCNDSPLFWSYLLEGVRPFIRSGTSIDFELIQSQFTQLHIRDWLAVMINHLQDTPVYMVLDDFQWIQHQGLVSDIEYFIRALPENVHVILLSRQPIPFYLAQWQMANQLLTIDQKTLAFTKEEALMFMEKGNCQLSSDLKQDYWYFSEGWIGGLQLLLADSVKTIQGLSRIEEKGLVYDYLRREMYGALPKEVQRFLLVTVQFSYFNRELSEELLPEQTYDYWLEQLERYHVMVQIVDHSQQLYRYHHLFEEFLLQQPFDQNGILHQGLVVFQELGDLEEAVTIALKLLDYEKAMALILEISQPLKMLFFMNQIPNEAMITNFDFTLQKFFFHYTNFEMDEGQAIYRLAINQLPENPEFELFRGMEYLIGDRQVVFDMPALSTPRIQQLKANETTKALMMIKNVTVLFHQCRYREGLAQIRFNQELTKALKSDFLTFYNLNIEAQLLEEMGCFNDALHVYGKIKELVGQSNSLSQISLFFELSYHISITGTYLKRFELDKAKKELEYIEEFEGAAIHEEAYLYNQVEYWYLNGESDRAWEGLSQLLQKAFFEELLPIANLLTYALEANQLSQQLKQSFQQKYEASEGKMKGATFLYLRLLMAEGCFEKADKGVEKMLLESRKERIPLQIVEGNLVKIRGLVGKPECLKEAQDLYREAVYYACDDEILQPFYLEQSTLRNLFQRDYQLIQQSLEGVEGAFHQSLVNRWQLVTSYLLTERERDVLKEIAKGLSTKEMARTLFISEATVKTHILNIYRKFEVNSRVAAVEKGQQMGILQISN